jgi:hypothetical protein
MLGVHPEVRGTSAIGSKSGVEFANVNFVNPKTIARARVKAAVNRILCFIVIYFFKYINVN